MVHIAQGNPLPLRPAALTDSPGVNTVHCVYIIFHLKQFIKCGKYLTNTLMIYYSLIHVL